MANIGAAHGVSLLNFSLGGAPATAPTVWALGVGLTAPTSTNAWEMTGGNGMTRQTVSFASAGSPANVSTNLVAATFGPISSAATVLGAHIWDTLASGGGKNLWYNTLTTSRTMSIGDSLVFAAGALSISIT